ncbi:hypothetical protein [Pseudooceanicola aestuarii]|uniref:hypothetical protein n=1 Tax=Pseudooceanicola aestuarii TaxID=2697319 RepID=UPI0013D2A24E|nr:hypothetical protein [Pseudooceanicola aestuarii]
MTPAAASSSATRPAFTFPEREGAALRTAYQEAEVILEYGAGGSTVLAAELPGKQVFSVESDADFLHGIAAWFDDNPPRAQVVLHHADIGPTREWGHPKSEAGWRRFASYPLGIWDRDDFTHPDVVLVDGRFRAGCALATAFRITRPVTLLIDDYRHRDQYHEVEDFLGAPILIGRLAVFDVTPMPIPADRLGDVIRMMTRA